MWQSMRECERCALTQRVFVQLTIFDDDHEVALGVRQHLDVLRGVAVDQRPIHPGATLKDTEVAEFGYSTLSPAQPRGLVVCLRER